MHSTEVTGDAKAAALTKLIVETQKVESLETELDGLNSKPAEDPIDKLNPAGKVSVVKQRQKIMQLKTDARARIAVYNNNLMNLDDVIKETKAKVSQERNEVKLALLDANLKK